MSATSNSAPGQIQQAQPVESVARPAHCLPVSRGPTTVLAFSVAVFAMIRPDSVRAAVKSEVADRAGLRCGRTYADARAFYHASPTNAEAAWQLGRACFDWAEFATNDTQRAKIAGEGIAACRQALGLNTNSAPTHYYLGMNLGQLADTKRNPSAFKIVKEIERSFLAARGLDEKFDYAGPDRNLGLLYSQAPVLISVGSRSKARQHLQRAVQLAPEYPENRLNFIEACLKWGDRTGARRELAALDTLWPAAQTNFAGDLWATSWADWEARLKKARKKIEGLVKTIESPRNRS